ncbi:MAG: 4-deoxy-4-formamido-L-arabinose-phosphoundecaprenol deformylase, partial [Opitutales bacterium]
LLPAPHIGRRNAHILAAVRQAGFEVGIHCYNHYRWQDHMQTMTLAEIAAEFQAAHAEFLRIFDLEARTAGAAGWQSNARSREVYDRARLLYSSDTRGTAPFFPRIDGRVFTTLEIPSTLPTFDELMGRPEYPDAAIVPHYRSLLSKDRINVFTIHAEIEGMGRHALFRSLLEGWRADRVKFVRLDEQAQDLLARRETVPVCDQVMAPIDGRSGLVATQAA